MIRKPNNLWNINYRVHCKDEWTAVGPSIAKDSKEAETNSRHVAPGPSDNSYSLPIGISQCLMSSPYFEWGKIGEEELLSLEWLIYYHTKLTPEASRHS